ncbi:DIP1984 family protein [Acinetobacter sp. S40]|uniref:DIP1984 family protein n=1 Tax=unclassified Acinetobacter TaxID=196816 RepID=UPI00190BA3CA|nr:MULTISPECIES: DIP1984 family protein [unclassified Acinetobacter]MBJ9985987.1 DIP1984 family protein [Acinetobacter sp. S40]MBK0064491.1 DIP1984 family protein [Acinetobacter sp. S55]MBK0067189.1 DIP1984 family protein [Acinetobacter sp. S54]
MKLAEALLLRSDLQKKLLSLQQRIQKNVLVQDGDTPSEDPKQLLQEAVMVNRQLFQLIQKIHQTNAQAQANNGKPLLDILNQRDQLTAEHRIIQQAIDNTQKDTDRYSVREIKWIKAISVSELQKQADGISQNLRLINLEIQASNWQIDLIE